MINLFNKSKKSSKKKLKKAEFNMKAKKFFLTFPQIPHDKLIDFPEIKERILKKQEIKNGIISREKHKDGNVHFHIYLEYIKTKTINRSNYFDFIFDHHGKYETCKTKSSTIKYVTKNMDYFLIGDLQSFSSGTLLRNFAKNCIQQGYDAHDFFSFKNDSQIDNLIYDDSLRLTRYGKLYRKYLHESALDKLAFIKSIDVKMLSDFIKRHPDAFPNPDQFLFIVTFLNDNMDPVKRPYKKKMLHLWSREPNTGKTSLLHFLQHVSPCYIWPDDNWFDTYNNDVYQWIIWDEWSPKGWDGTFLNRFLAGEKMRLPMKGSHTRKADNPLIILTSNKSMDEHCEGKWYRQRDEAVSFTRTFRARVDDYQLMEPLFTDFVKFREALLHSTTFLPVRSRLVAPPF